MNQPSLDNLHSNVSSVIKSKFGIATDLKNWLNALALSIAGNLKLVYLYMANVNNNVWPDTCDRETLIRFGKLKLKREPYAATFGEYTISFTGTNGSTLPLGSQFKSISDVNTQLAMYITTESKTLSGTTGTINVIANVEGLKTLLSVGQELYTVNPITGIDQKATVTAITVMPLDEETTEDYRELVLKRFSIEYNPGSNGAYAIWALDLAGIRAVYPFSSSGQVLIYAEATESASTDGHGTASQALMDGLWKSSDKTGVFEINPDTTVEYYSRLRRQCGLTDIKIRSVTPLAVNVTISGLKDQSPSVKSTIQTNIKKRLKNIRPYIAGVSPYYQSDLLKYSDIVSAIDDSVVRGNYYESLVITVNGSTLPYRFLNGNIPYLNTITYA